MELNPAKSCIWHGQFDEKYLLSNKEVFKLAGNLFGDEYISMSGDYGGGIQMDFWDLLRVMVF